MFPRFQTNSVLFFLKKQKINWKPGGHTCGQTNNFLKFGSYIYNITCLLFYFCYVLFVSSFSCPSYLSVLVSSYLVLCDVVAVPQNKKNKKESKKQRKEGSKETKENNKEAKQEWKKARKKKRKKQREQQRQKRKDRQKVLYLGGTQLFSLYL